MATPITDYSPAQPAEVRNTTATKPNSNVATVAESRAQLNVSIVQASINVSISSNNQPLALLLKSAITGINEALKPQLGDNAIQNAASEDNTPEGTAGRIVSLSTGFFQAYKDQHPGGDDAETLKSFMSTIGSGFEQGVKEARDILKGLGVLNGDIADNIDKTYALVQKGFADFTAAQSKQPDAPAGTSG